ncbi:MAG TPA: hypothetical protein DEP66_00640 [Acidimicrobiaceae bacterium]|nr:hypothetical protein [Acidimicrobiaceae bacterium]HCB36753.1 hypothetical protein [Acidimicrobiaceae bacterium]
MSLATVVWGSAPARARRRAGAARAGAPRAAAAPARARRGFGLRVVGVSVVMSVAALAVLMGLAVFHSVLASGQYRLSELETEVAAERSRLVDLQVELESLHAPSELQTMGEGALGLVAAEGPTDLAIAPDHIRAAAGAAGTGRAGGEADWLELKGLLSASASTRSPRS